MNSTSHLILLESAAFRHLYRLREVVRDATGLRGFARDQRVGYATVEGLNTWTQFSRAYYLSWRLQPGRKSRPPITLGGTCTHGHGCPLGPPATWSPDDAVAHAINMRRKSKTKFVKTTPTKTWGDRDEPPWFREWILPDLATDLNASHESDIRAAFAVTVTNVFGDLPQFRNFYAHRSERTGVVLPAIARVNTVPASARPTEMLLARPIGRPQALLLDWLDDIQHVIEELCK
jgi:hypothetical protein